MYIALETYKNILFYISKTLFWMQTHNSSGYFLNVFPILVWCQCVAVVMVSYSVICSLSWKDCFREMIDVLPVVKYKINHYNNSCS